VRVGRGFTRTNVSRAEREGKRSFVRYYGILSTLRAFAEALQSRRVEGEAMPTSSALRREKRAWLRSA
jgi:hypothetical protein